MDADRLTLSVEAAPTPDDQHVVHEGLLAFNVAVVGPPHHQPLACFLRDSASRVAGGLLGHIRWRWLYVSTLWIPEPLRGRGWGTRLMRAAEAHAREQGCIGAHLDTLEYQALPFYEKLGYDVFGVLDGYPPGYRQYHLSKRLRADGD